VSSATEKENSVSQINLHPTEHAETVDTSGDRSAAAGINLITVLIVLGVLAVIAWYLFTGPLSMNSGSSTTNINVNPAPTTVNVNPPSQPNAPAPPSNPGNTAPGNTAPGNPPPSKP
jgi:hypothetical protein